jgi:hypothetical protein
MIHGMDVRSLADSPLSTSCKGNNHHTTPEMRAAVLVIAHSRFNSAG